jgi:acyl-CoA synthetase (AMP-forming)/AMP-acid ligase II
MNQSNPLSGAFARTLRDGGAGGGLIFREGVCSWQALADVVAAFDLALQTDGWGPGTIVAIPGRNTPAASKSFIATIATGRCVAVLNGSQPMERIVMAATAVGASVLVVGEDDLDVALKWTGPIYALCDDGRLVRHFGGTTVESQAHGAKHSIILSTSGTTGIPKQIPLDGTTMCRALHDIRGFNIGFGDHDLPGPAQPPLIQYSPLAHSSGTLTLARGVAEGRSVVILGKFEPARWSDIVAEHRPRTTGLPPAMMKMLLDAAPARERLASLVSVWSGSAPVDPATVAEFSARFGIPVLGNYGATEFYGAVATWSLSDYHTYSRTKAGAVGRLRADIAEARVWGEAEQAYLADGATGILELKVNRLGDAWFRTSDLAHLDGDRFLYLHGRADDAINRGGFKITPDIVAAVLMEHPAVREAVVVGIPDVRLGEVPAAAVEFAKHTVHPSEAELKAFVRERLPAYFIPVAVRAMPQIPRTPAMKFDRPAIRVFLAGEIAKSGN